MLRELAIRLLRSGAARMEQTADRLDTAVLIAKVKSRSRSRFYPNPQQWNPLAPDEEVCWPLSPKTPLLQFIEEVFQEDGGVSVLDKRPVPTLGTPLTHDPIYLRFFMECQESLRRWCDDVANKGSGL